MSAWENSWLPTSVDSTLSFPISCLLSIPDTPQPCSISVQQTASKTDPGSYTQNNCLYRAWKIKHMEIKSRVLTKLMGSRNDLRENKSWWCKTFIHNSFEKAMCRAGSWHYETCPPSRWKQPQYCLVGLICIKKFQSICPEFLSSKVCAVGPVSERNGKPCHFRAWRVRKGDGDRGDCDPKQMQWRETKTDSTHIKALCSSDASIQPTCADIHICFCKTLDLKAHKNKVQHVPWMFSDRLSQATESICSSVCIPSSYFLLLPSRYT